MARKPAGIVELINETFAARLLATPQEGKQTWLK